MATLPHNLDLFFERTPRSKEVSLSVLFPKSPWPKQIEKARHNMNLAADGGIVKRGGITVESRGDGTYDIIKGSSTYEVAKENGWPTMLIELPVEPE